MNEKILFVDDDTNILQGYKRSLRNKYDLHIAAGPKAGIQALKNNGPFAVIVSDYASFPLPAVETRTRSAKVRRA